MKNPLKSGSNTVPTEVPDDVKAEGGDLEVVYVKSVDCPGCLRMQPKVGGKLHLRLNTDTSPIADKYREGKLKRTLKREFKST